MKAIKALFFILSLFLPLFASPAESYGQPVKLGFIQPDSSLVNSHVLRQYYISYLDELSKQTDWDYQLVHIKADTAFAQLFAGDVDLLLSVEYPSSFGMHSGIYYSSMDFGYDIEGLYTRENEQRFDPKDLNTLNGAHVGVIAHRPINDRFEEFQQNNHLTFTIHEFASQQEMLAALADGVVDMVVDTATNTTAAEHFLIAYTRVPVRVATDSTHRDRLAEMELALKRLNTENPHFEPQLSQTLAENLDFQLVHYTPLESQYIKDLPPLRIAIYGGSRPYILYDEQTHTATGIYPELIAAIAQNSGLKFSYIHVKSYDEAVQLLNDGEADLMLDIFAGAENHTPFYFTNPLLEIPYTFIGKTAQAPSASESITLAVSHPEPSLMSFLKQKFPRWHIVETSSMGTEALEQVHSKKADLALIRNATLEIDRPLMLHPDLTIIPDASINVPTSLVISPAQPRILQGILNKAITQINPEKRIHITQKYLLDAKPTFSLQHILTYYPLQSGLIIGLVLLLLVIMAFLNHHNKAMERAKSLLQEKNAFLTATIHELKAANKSKNFYKEMAHTDTLTGILNKLGIETAGEDIFSTAPSDGHCHALFIIDLDHFKEANDALGHQRGDDILRRFALILIHIIRAQDAAGRFGGDEFILVLKDLPRETVATIAQRINVAAHSLEPATAQHPPISTSIGVALCPDHGSTYQELLHYADQALYQVKEQGRDGWLLARTDHS